MNWDTLRDAGRLVAEHAVAACRAVSAAVGKAAPRGLGLAGLEQAAHKEGFVVRRRMAISCRQIPIRRSRARHSRSRSSSIRRRRCGSTIR